MKKSIYHPTLNTAEKALSFIDYDDRDTWVRMAMAMRSEFGADGFDIWDCWSQQSSKYNKQDAKSVWRSAKPGGGVNFATLIHYAQDAGFVPSDNDKVQISPEQIEARKIKREADEHQYAEELKQIRGEVKRIATEAWNNSIEAYEHPYATKKGIKIYGARIGNFPVYKQPEPGKKIEAFKQIPALLIPVLDSKDGKIVSLQAYFAEDQEYYGDRAYLKSGQKQGGYCLIGSIKNTIAIVEGYATGCSVHEATGWTVMVAFDKGNLKEIAKTAHKLFPQNEIIIAGDNDVSGDGNKAAVDAGQAINARVILPNTVGMDWNDVHAAESLESVQAQLMAHMVPVPINDSAPIEFDEYTPFPQVTGNGKPKGTIPNLEELLRRLGATVRYNVIKKDIEILIPGHSASRDNRLVSCLAEIISYCNLVGLPTGDIGGALTRIADKNQYNPVLTWVNSKPWDGINRWDDFCRTVTPKEEKLLPDGTPLHIALIKRWMVSAIAAASRDGTALQGALILQGEQGLGKTSWLKSLVPENLNIVKDGLSLNPDNKDSVKKVISFWLVELGEVNGTLKKSDQESLKAFLTKDSDEIRLPYARAESEFGRRTAFFGSVNPKAFLQDETGSRRWWVIECSHVNYSHNFDMQQVWAEILNAYINGEQWHLTTDEFNALNENNESFQVIDPIEERILSSLEWDSDPSRWRWTTATELLIEIGIDKPSRADTIKASACIRKHNNDRSKRSNGKNLLLAPSITSVLSDNFNRPF